MSLTKQILTSVVSSVVVAVLVLMAWPTPASLGGSIHTIEEEFGRGLNITNDGCLKVDGTCVIDASGNLDGAVTASSGTFSGRLTTDGGFLRSSTLATSTTATTYTLTQANISNIDTILMTPNTGALTLTLPATSTLTTMIPSAGDRADLCIYNATTTAAATITIAAGTGIDFERSATTTTATSAGNMAISAQNYACIKFIRESDTDVGALIDFYRDLD